MDNNKNALRNSLILFMICLLVHAFEAIVIRTDETFFAECFINKLFGIAALIVMLRITKMSLRDIGCKSESMLSSIAKGFGICAAATRPHS